MPKPYRRRRSRRRRNRSHLGIGGSFRGIARRTRYQEQIAQGSFGRGGGPKPTIDIHDFATTSRCDQIAHLAVKLLAIVEITFRRFLIAQIQPMAKISRRNQHHPQSAGFYRFANGNAPLEAFLIGALRHGNRNRRQSRPHHLQRTECTMIQAIGGCLTGRPALVPVAISAFASSGAPGNTCYKPAAERRGRRT